jgi:hypothetical protein
MKLAGRLRNAAPGARFAQGAIAADDRREQRRRDAAAGLVAFACKLPQPLVERLQAHAAGQGGDLNAAVAALLTRALDADPEADAGAGDEAAGLPADAAAAVAAAGVSA